MTTIPLTLSDAELAAYREKRLELLVRLAEKCGPCEGSGYVLCTDPDSRSFDPCLACNGTGYRNPLGESGDVLFHQEEWGVSGRDDYDDAVEIEIRLASPDETHWVMFGDDNAPFVPELCTIQPADTMPFWASRIHLTRTDEPRFVSLERLREISPTLWREFLDEHNDIDPLAEVMVVVGGVK